MKEFYALRAKTWAHLRDDDTEHKKAKKKNKKVCNKKKSYV